MTLTALKSLKEAHAEMIEASKRLEIAIGVALLTTDHIVARYKNQYETNTHTNQ